jgi:type IV pilus assembly protein PilO
MADLNRTRRAFKATAGVLGTICGVAVLYLVMPLGRTNAELDRDLADARNEFKQKEIQVRPLRGLPEKLVKTHEDIQKFYRDRLPARQSAVSEEIGTLASTNHVTLSDVHYENQETEIPDLRAVLVDTQLSGEYANVAKFINAIERDKTFFIVDGITLDEQKAGAVRLQLKLETYLRPSNVESAPDKSPVKSKDKSAGPAAGKTGA